MQQCEGLGCVMASQVDTDSSQHNEQNSAG